MCYTWDPVGYPIQRIRIVRKRRPRSQSSGEIQWDYLLSNQGHDMYSHTYCTPRSLVTEGSTRMLLHPAGRGVMNVTSAVLGTAVFCVSSSWKFDMDIISFAPLCNWPVIFEQTISYHYRRFYLDRETTVHSNQVQDLARMYGKHMHLWGVNCFMLPFWIEITLVMGLGFMANGADAKKENNVKVQPIECSCQV